MVTYADAGAVLDSRSLKSLAVLLYGIERHNNKTVSSSHFQLTTYRTGIDVTDDFQVSQSSKFVTKRTPHFLVDVPLNTNVGTQELYVVCFIFST